MDKKQKYFFVLAIITGIILVTGATYALFTYLGVGSKVHSISTATLTMSYTEDTNGITLNGALPTTDTTGKNLPNYFDFTVTKTGGIEDIINYEIAAKKEDGNTIEGKWIKLYLTEIVDGQEQEVMAPTTYSEALGENEDTGRPSGMMSLTTGTYPSGIIEKHYRLRMWVSEEYNPQGDGGGLTFTVKINVYGKMKDPVKRLMAARIHYSSTENFYKYKDSITSVETKQDITVPSTALYQYDVSKAKDGNVIAYLEDDGSGNSTYKLTIGANGGVIFFNENSSNLFYSFSKLTSIDLTNVDTSEVTDMSGMFEYCNKLVDLDVSNFDTLNVTSMRRMFNSSSNLTALDLSNFNTSNVTNMNGMFFSCKNLTTLDVSHFDTSQVTNMKSMFGSCSSLTNLDLRSFDTSKVTDMSWLFQYCSNLTQILVTAGKWTTANATTSYMFDQYGVSAVTYA